MVMIFLTTDEAKEEIDTEKRWKARRNENKILALLTYSFITLSLTAIMLVAYTFGVYNDIYSNTFL